MPVPQLKIKEAKKDFPKKSIHLVPCFFEKKASNQKEKELIYPKLSQFFPQNLENKIKEISKEENFEGKEGQSIFLRHIDQNFSHVLLCGCGNLTKANISQLEKTLFKILKQNIYVKSLDALVFYMIENDEEIFRKLGTGTLGALFQLLYRSRESLSKSIDIKNFFYCQSSEVSYLSQKDWEKIQDISFGRALAMDLVNSPPNIKNTKLLVTEAKTIAKEKNISVKIQNDITWIKKNMPAFYTVARGSLKSDPPRWVHLKKKAKSKKPFRLALVGKSVMFDTGGYQIKPGQYMNTMKADMTGGATVLSIFSTLAKYNLDNIDLHGFLASTPNMIDTNAFVPDSIIDSSCGKKIEIKHTDAEGRLTLIDAVYQASLEDVDLIISIATLTGAASRAVGPRSALMSLSKKWQDLYLKTANEIGEETDTLSITEEDFESIDSKLDSADICNDSHNIYRGAQTAAAFILHGLGNDKKKLLHLDIAGGDMSPEGKATGIATQGLLNFIFQLEKELSKGNLIVPWS